MKCERIRVMLPCHFVLTVGYTEDLKPTFYFSFFKVVLEDLIKSNIPSLCY